MSHRISRISERLFAAVCAAIFALGLTPAAAQPSASAEEGREKSATCAACHGPDGNSPSPEWPSLAGQHAAYTIQQLEAFSDGTRPDVLGMKGFADALSEQDMRDIAAFYEAQALAPKGANPDLVSRGQAIYRGGIPDRGVAACIACHGPSGKGNPLAAYPRVSHQHADYIAKALQDYADGTRRSDAGLNQMMRNVAEMLFDDEIRALASYMQGLQ